MLSPLLFSVMFMVHIRTAGSIVHVMAALPGRKYSSRTTISVQSTWHLTQLTHRSFMPVCGMCDGHPGLYMRQQMAPGAGSSNPRMAELPGRHLQMAYRRLVWAALVSRYRPQTAIAFTQSSTQKTTAGSLRET